MTAYSSALAVTTSDSATIQRTKALYVGVSGDVKVMMAGNAAAVVYKAAPVGLLPIEVTQVFATGTAATNILALY